MSKSRLCKIIPAQVIDVVEDSYILSLPDGEQYKVEGGSTPMKKGSLIRFGKDTFLKLINDIIEPDFEEITILKEDLKETIDADFTVECNTNKEKNYAVWQDASTRLLIDSYKELRPSVNGQTFKTMRNMWETVSSRLQKAGFTFDHQQVESKWKSLVRSYRSSITQRAKRKGVHQVGPFEHEIGEILASQGISFELVNNEDENLDEIFGNSCPSNTPLTRSRKLPKLQDANVSANTNSTSNDTTDMSLLIQAINRRTAQKERADQLKYDQRERLLSAIHERNILLKRILLQKENK